jgi:hypothetical protein
MHVTKFSLTSLLVCAVLLLATGGAGAKDLKGRAGIGVEQTIGGVSGLTLRYWPAQAFGISLTAGADIVRYEGVDESGATEWKFASVVETSVGVMYNFARSLHANMGVGIRASLGFQSGETNDIVPALGDKFQVTLEIPLQLEFFLSDSFSVSVATGIVFAFVPEEGPTLKVDAPEEIQRNDSTVIGLGAGSVTGSLGIVYYF